MYQALAAKAKKLEALSAQDTDESNEQYYALQNEFNTDLRYAMSDDGLMKRLTKAQLLNVLAWCSSHRPYAPHIILTSFAKLAK